MKKLFLVLLALALAGGYWYYRSLTTGPEYALLQAKEAAQKHDLAAFEKYAEVEKLTENLIDQLLSGKSGPLPILPGLEIDPGALTFLKPQLVENAAREVRRYIVTGRVHTNPSGPFFSIAAVAGVLIGEDTKFKGLDYVRQDGDTALVGLAFVHPRFNTTLVLEIKMLDKGNHWQAVEFTNVAELLKQVFQLEKQRQNGN